MRLLTRISPSVCGAVAVEQREDPQADSNGVTSSLAIEGKRDHLLCSVVGKPPRRGVRGEP